MEVIDSTHVKVVFNEGLLLPDENPETVFTITPYDKQTEFLTIEKVEFDTQDDSFKTLILTTALQNKDQSYIITAGINLTNLNKNPVVSGVYDTGFFLGTDIVGNYNTLTNSSSTGSTTSTGETATTSLDLTAPEEITNFNITEKLLELNEYLVNLSWTKSLNTAGDLIDQILYKSLNRGSSYDTGVSLGMDANSYETRLEGGKEYTFKITTKDRSGNESTGVIKSIRLPQTGPGLALLIAISGLGASQILRKKKK